MSNQVKLIGFEMPVEVLNNVTYKLGKLSWEDAEPIIKIIQSNIKQGIIKPKTNVQEERINKGLALLHEIENKEKLEADRIIKEKEELKLKELKDSIRKELLKKSKDKK